MQDTKKNQRKRQWGTEKHTTPLPVLHEKPSTTKIALGRMFIVLTIFFWAFYILSTIIRQFIDGPHSYQFTMESIGYALVVSLLTFSALMYLIARQGALERFRKHMRVPRSIIDRYFANHQPSMTVLVPSFAEEPQVIRKTLLSASLQEYPNLRVVLLLDDNPYPTNPFATEKLEATRALQKNIKSFLHQPAQRFTKALNQFEQTNKKKKSVAAADVMKLAREYIWAASWLEKKAEEESIEDHVDTFFANHILKDLAKDLGLMGEALTLSAQEGASLSTQRVRELYQRLSWIFTAHIEIFERKQYASLSQEANKAMNINSYIGLMGGVYRKESTPDGLLLFSTKKKQKGDLEIPDSEFLLTLDADSLLLREYCLRLVYFLQQPDNKRVAVAQTPYSSFRGAYSRIERLSGATTDMQHILHQGMTYYGATFWVGANAVIRKKALEDIVQKEWIGGFEVKRYIQDRTVIEDTESSVDLTQKGWRLVNYPERLSYSATPPDFGSLVVQRRRWANGGLLIVPKLLLQKPKDRQLHELVSYTEVLLRLNYMASIAWASFGLLFLLAYPYDGRLLSPLVLFAALPYFIAMAADLKYCGYNYSDIFRIYGFNLILLPVNLAGVLKSIEQAFTGKKIPFARTPKVKNRTSTSLPFLLFPLLIIAFSLFTLWRNVVGQNWGNAAFAGFNAFAAFWALVAYIGIDNVLVDMWIGLTSWLYVEYKAQKIVPTTKNPDLDWRVVLYHGEKQGKVPHQSFSHPETIAMP